MPPRIQRIVSLVPSTTESVFALGMGDKLVGCTRYCNEPADRLFGVPRIGGTKNPDLEGIAELEPDLVLCNAEENRVEDISWLRERFVVLQQTPCSVVEAASDLRELALWLDAQDAVQPFLLRIEAQLAAAEVARIERDPVRVFYPIWKKPWMSINRATFIHDVLRVAGGINLFGDSQERYPQVTLDEVMRRRPEVVLLPSEPWEFDDEQRATFASEKTFGSARLSLCDGRDFCWHGTRMADGLGRAAELIRGLAGRDR